MADTVQHAHALRLGSVLRDDMSFEQEKAAIEGCLRRDPALAKPLLLTVLNQKHRSRAALEEVRKVHEEQLKVLTDPPWQVGVFLWLAPEHDRALVALGSRRFIVGVGHDVDRDTLRPGRPVFLNTSQNALTGVASSLPRPGVVGEFSRLHGATQAVVRGPADEEVVVDLADEIAEAGIRPGDLLVYDREASVAYERIPPKHGKSGLLEELPLDVSIENLGGLDGVFEELTAEVTLHLFHSELVGRFGLKPTKGVLLCGPPGTGKTSLVQALGDHLSRVMGLDVKVFLVRPGVHRSMWYGASEQRVRDLFREAKETAEPANSYVVLFFDDVDHLGSRDHRAAGEVDARLLPCFLQEIDAVRCPRLMLIGATNREDLLDEAFLRPGRLGRILPTPRPDRRGAREIFRRHLPPDLPMSDNGHGPGDAIHDLIDDVLASIYASNGELSRLAMLTFRDGSRHPLLAVQVMSGALIAAAADQVKHQGCLRGLQGGPAQIWPADLHKAVAGELVSISERLKPGPALNQMVGLPPDVDVVRIELCRTSQDPQRIEYVMPSPA